jgi:hypothetical protein
MTEETKKKLSPRDKFLSLANKRVVNAAKYISLVGNLSDKSNYSYTDQDTRKIFSYLKKKLNDSQDRFNNSGSKDKDGFKLE